MNFSEAGVPLPGIERIMKTLQPRLWPCMYKQQPYRLKPSYPYLLPRLLER